MIPVPKPKFFARKVPFGKSEDEYFEQITARQTHILRDAIDRVSFIQKFLTERVFWKKKSRIIADDVTIGLRK